MISNYPENRFEKMIAELKDINSEGGVPVCILGGGQTGKKILLFLEMIGIKVHSILVDWSYYEDSPKRIEKKTVYCTEEFVAACECIVVIGFRGYEEGRLYSIENSKVIKEYCLDFIGRLVLREEYHRPITENYCKEHINDFIWLEENLADKKSVRALDDFLYQRIHGDYEKKNYDDDQYFLSEIISLAEGEVFVDCGAFQGETTLEFINRMNFLNVGYKKVVAFEPEPENVKEMLDSFKGMHDCNVVQAGAWEKSTVLHMRSNEGNNSSISDEGDIIVPVKSIDDVLGGEKATYIKMDIEGSELRALKGAKDTIIKYKPKLAICIYHKREDLIEIPRYIKNLNNNYQLYIRNHSANGVETVLYAV